MTQYALHFQTDKAPNAAASIHVSGCRHANLRPRVVSQLVGTTTVEALRDDSVRDLVERGYTVRVAPCTRES